MAQPRAALPSRCTSSKMTHLTSRIRVEPAKACSRSISVVMTRQLASSLMVTSPVTRPTSPKNSCSSRYFWLDSALIGDE